MIETKLDRRCQFHKLIGKMREGEGEREIKRERER